MESVDLIAEDYSILSYDFTVYLFDRRKNIPESYSHNEMANDTVEAMRTLRLTTVSIFGVSQGGMIAMDIAINNPEIVEKMVLGSTSCLITDEQYRQINSLIAYVLKHSLVRARFAVKRIIINCFAYCFAEVNYEEYSITLQL